MMFRHKNKNKKIENIFRVVHASRIKTETRKTITYSRAEQTSPKENPWRIKPASRHESLLREQPLPYVLGLCSDTDERIRPTSDTSRSRVSVLTYARPPCSWFFVYWQEVGRPFCPVSRLLVPFNKRKNKCTMISLLQLCILPTA